MSKVTAIIVNYRSADHTLNCIKSLLQQEGIELEILVVDNASGDHSVQQIRTAYPEIKLIENPHNDGFAKANNYAAAQASGDYILVINPDIKLLNPDVVAGLIAVLASNSHVGVVGPDILESRRGKRVLPRYHYPLQKKLKKQVSLNNLPGQIAWLLGACMLFPKGVYDKIGGFDNNFFLYGEDTDICLRLRHAGYSIAWAPDIKVDHWAGASESSSSIYDTRIRKKRGYYQFCTKHYAIDDLLPVLRRQYSKCRFYNGLLKLRSMINGATDAAAMQRNMAEMDVLKEIINSRA